MRISNRMIALVGFMTILILLSSQWSRLHAIVAPCVKFDCAASAPCGTSTKDKEDAAVCQSGTATAGTTTCFYCNGTGAGKVCISGTHRCYEGLAPAPATGPATMPCGVTVSGTCGFAGILSTKMTCLGAATATPCNANLCTSQD
jgi:hypothetical protein